MSLTLKIKKFTLNLEANINIFYIILRILFFLSIFLLKSFFCPAECTSHTVGQKKLPN